MDFCGGGVAAGSKVMVVWGELQAGGEALQVMCCFKSVKLLLAQESDCIDEQNWSSLTFDLYILQNFVEELQKQVGTQPR